MHLLEARNWHALRHQSNEQSSAPPRHHHTEHPSDTGQNQALSQQLADQPLSARAERSAHRHFAPPRRGAGEQQICDVDTRDEKHAEDGAKQHQ